MFWYLDISSVKVTWSGEITFLGGTKQRRGFQRVDDDDEEKRRESILVPMSKYVVLCDILSQKHILYIDAFVLRGDDGALCSR